MSRLEGDVVTSGRSEDPIIVTWRLRGGTTKVVYPTRPTELFDGWTRAQAQRLANDAGLAVKRDTSQVARWAAPPESASARVAREARHARSRQGDLRAAAPVSP